MSIAETLAESDIGKGLDEAQAEELANICQEVEFKEGHLLIEEGSRGEELYLLEEGRVDVEIRVPLEPKKRVKLYTGRKGEVFGEISFLDGSPRSASVRTLDKAKALVIDEAKLRNLMEKDEHMGLVITRNLALILCKRLRTMDLQLRNALSGMR